ncbi:MAG TPA: sigma-70 family RNA polymerase sigma factor [Candidatus Kapabacteria bacterium]|nr:sigma-70 family RNA polymerase sigma factor [Candidatus Kapabacteria bacterium]
MRYIRPKARPMYIRVKPEYKAKSAAADNVREIITDEELWRAFQNGEDAAFNMLYGRYADRVYSYLKLLMSTSPGQLDDLFQEAWIQLFRNREKFTVSGNGSVAGWLFRLAHNMAISELRKKHVALSIEDLKVDTDLIEGFITPATQEEFDRPPADEIMRHVMKSVEKLPILLREVFILSEFNGLALDRIAETLGVTKQNAKVRLFRARRMIREDLARTFDITSMGDAAY